MENWNEVVLWYMVYALFAFGIALFWVGWLV